MSFAKAWKEQAMHTNDLDHHDVFPGGRAGRAVPATCQGVIVWEQAFGLLITRLQHPKAVDRRAYYNGRCSSCGEAVRQPTAPARGQTCRRVRP